MDRVLLVMEFNPGGLGLIDYLHHISELKRIAEFYALKSFTSFSTFLSVHFFLDNSTALCYINKSGGTKSRALCDLARLIVDCCVKVVE